MIEPAAFFEALKRHDLSFFTGVPDSLLKDLCAYVTDHVPADHHVITANEGSAVALAAGYHLATNRIPVVYLQNSGLGNAINPLLSLADPAVYAFPMVLVIGWRGEPGVKDEPQHVAQGQATETLLRALKVPFAVVAGHSDPDEVVGRARDSLRRNPRPHALLVRRDTFAPYAMASGAPDGFELTRPQAVEAVLEATGPECSVVSTTGMTSREVFAFRERRGDGHARDFLTVGSMGHCSQIALGIAKARPDRRVVCLDGDGAVIMHMGSLAIIGTQGPANLLHVVINNGAHDSVGGQPTAGRLIDLRLIANGCGYRHARLVTTKLELTEATTTLMAAPGPSLLEIRVRSDPRTDAGRPTTTPLDNKRAFMRALGSDVR